MPIQAMRNAPPVNVGNLSGGSQKIAESAVRLRLDPSNWPPDLDRNEQSGPFAMNKAIELAAEAFTAFKAARQTHITEKKLTPAGVKAADADWAATHLPTLRERLVRIRSMAHGLDTSLVRELTEQFTKPAAEPHDLALLQEIRTWLRSLPEAERLSRAQKLAADGDKTALRALLTAPAYLTGVDENLLAQVRDEAAKRADPRRYAKLEAMRRASLAADRAVEGVIRYVEQETATGFSRGQNLR
jgi:hypothetical protein